MHVTGVGETYMGKIRQSLEDGCRDAGFRGGCPAEDGPSSRMWIRNCRGGMRGMQTTEWPTAVLRRDIKCLECTLQPARDD